MKTSKMLCGLMAFIMAAVGSIAASASAEDVQAGQYADNMCESKNAPYYSGYLCEKDENGNIVKVSDENGNAIVEMSYDEAGNRVSKNSIVYNYEEGILVSEERDGTEIKYNYDYRDSSPVRSCISFTVNGVLYYLDRNEHGTIVSVSDESGCETARYEYDGIGVSRVLEKRNNEWLENKDEEFIGNYNKIRLYGGYYDSETGWYYENGRYTDTAANLVIGLTYNPGVTEYKAETENKEYSLYGLYGYEEDDLEAELWKDRLMADASFTSAKPENWATSPNVSLVEKIARAIYGENTINIVDQRGVAWVMLNRLHSTLFANTLNEIVVVDQFYGVNSPEGLGTMTGSAAWNNAVYLACLMCINSTEACWNSVSPRPIGISGQLYFLSASDHRNDFVDKDGRIYCTAAGCNCFVTDVAIAGKGSFGSAAALINTWNNMSTSAQLCNIFFNK